MISKSKECWICGTNLNLHKHHCIFGSKRKLCDEDGLIVYLCADCHINVHIDRKWKYWQDKLKEVAQEYYEENIGTREQFLERYDENYL